MASFPGLGAVVGAGESDDVLPSNIPLPGQGCGQTSDCLQREDG
jgi:hypothetical protein